jgi:hypothetical protein
MGTPRDGDRKPQRAIRRCHETSRFEEQLWNLVYEELWSVVCRSVRRAMKNGGCEQSAESDPAPAHAKGA